MSNDMNYKKYIDFSSPASICEDGDDIKIGFHVCLCDEKTKETKEIGIEWYMPHEVIAKPEIPELVKDLVRRVKKWNPPS